MLVCPLLLLSACTNSINLPLDHVKISDGYLNSSSLDFGHVLIWDTTTNNTSHIGKVTQQAVAGSDVSINEGPQFSRKQSSLTSDTKLDVSGNVSPQIKGQAEAAFIRSTQVTLEQFNPKEFGTPEYALNCAALHSWRAQLPTAYSDKNYRFVFISRVVNATNISISKGASGNPNMSASVIKVGNYKFNTSYDNKNQTSIQSNGQSPLIVAPTVFSFDNSGNNLRFRQDLNTIYKF